MHGEYVKLLENLSMKVDDEETNELTEAIDPINQKEVIKLIKSFTIEVDDENGIYVKGNKIDTIDVKYSPEGSSGRAVKDGDDANEKRLEEGLKESLAMVKRFVKNEIKSSINTVKAYFRANSVEDEAEKKQILNHLLETYNARVVMHMNLIPPDDVNDETLREKMKSEYIKKANEFTIFKGVDESGAEDIKMYAKKYPFEAYKIEKILKNLNFKQISSAEYAEEMIGKAS